MATLAPDLIDDTPPLDERGLVSLVCPKVGATILLTSDAVDYLPNGSYRTRESGRKIKFRDSRARITLEDFYLLKEHPAYTGAGGEPKIVFLEHERPVLSGSTGVQVVDGAQNAGTGRRVPPPLHKWNEMTPKAVSGAIRAGLITNPVEALKYESEHRNRPGVVVALAHLIANPGEKPLTANQMAAADRRAQREREEAEAEGGTAAPLTAPAPVTEPQDPPDDDPDEDPEDQLRRDLAALIEDAVPDGELDDGDAEPAPGDGVL